MTLALSIIAPVVLAWFAWRWLLGPERAPLGWDQVPEDWDVEAAKRAMSGNEDAR
jgi:hypothetical protein